MLHDLLSFLKKTRVRQVVLDKWFPLIFPGRGGLHRRSQEVAPRREHLGLGSGRGPMPTRSLFSDGT